ncbi:uncharacterized protein LOC111079203 [Drosophila obscura]|uniref:uncharacterized protein LOC111079203 n=1 Tax=Drosophila obscura TaxID=7282 RepID=UPI001BB24C51|nr:uncharacterized protein LOC111079203 [Drosophila obscura]
MKDQQLILSSLILSTLLLLLLLLKEPHTIEARVFRVTKMECRTLDPTFSLFKTCKVVHREHGRAALYVHITMPYKGPIDDIIVNLGVIKILKNRHFQFVNETLDFCSFRRHPLVSGFIGFLINPLLKITNINTSCPLQQDYIFNGFPIDESTLKEIPLPKGVYVLQLRTSMLKKWRTDIKVYATRVDGYT